MTDIEDPYEEQFSRFYKEKMVTVEQKSLQKKELKSKTSSFYHTIEDRKKKQMAIQKKNAEKEVDDD